MERLRPYLMLSPALLIIVLFFLGGLGVGLMRSFNYMPIIGLTEPNLDAYVGILTDRTFLRSLGLTLYIAIASTAISMTLAIASGLLLRRSFRGKQVMTFLFQLNLPIPHIVGAIGILFLFTQGGFLARAAHAIHLIEQPA
ncbi:MAG: sugar ABC transporter permease, partial [Caldilineaceae bacterium]|nr:sugar ABC transporter permease [Caldilineaceae bacterium]